MIHWSWFYTIVKFSIAIIDNIISYHFNKVFISAGQLLISIKNLWMHCFSNVALTVIQPCGSLSVDLQGFHCNVQMEQANPPSCL